MDSPYFLTCKSGTMADIYHDLWIKRDIGSVFKGITSRPGLDHWWTLSSEGEPAEGAKYRLYFGPDYDWEAIVSAIKVPELFEWTLTKSDKDWEKTKIRFKLSSDGPFTKVSFVHSGWLSVNDHYKRSSYCWAMYLRALKNYLENGEIVPYAIRTAL